MSYYQSIHSKAVTGSRNTNFHLESMIYAPPLGQSIDSELLNESVPYIIEIKGRFKLGDTLAPDLKIASVRTPFFLMTLTLL
jgi:hypothetical protein